MKEIFKPVSIAAVVFLAVAFVNLPATAQARSVSSVKNASFNVSASIMQNLKNYTGKEVVIYLNSGKYFQGYVKNISESLIHLEKIAGKDFYDALIQIEDIIAIEAKFREMK
ncbi:MAG: hypothetical protein ABFD50_23355 [Smithella sp.]